FTIQPEVCSSMIVFMTNTTVTPVDLPVVSKSS
ncbi:MAG: hypothetical protein ACI9HA_002270, partial [Dinoroseobacter sp.]